MDGAKVKYWREVRGWTQRQLAEHAGTTNVAVSQIELGKRRPRPSMITKLATALDVDPRELMHEPGHHPDD